MAAVERCRKLVVSGGAASGASRGTIWIQFATREVFAKRSFRFGSWVLTKLTNILYGSRLTDEPTCYKLFHRDSIEGMRLRCTGFEFCPEITAKVLKRGHEIIELPISYQGRTVAEGKKINWKDGVIGIWTLLRYRVSD